MALTKRFLNESLKLERQAKPCPFCGSKRVYVGPESWEAMIVKCRKCRASGAPASIPDTYTVPRRFVVKGKVPAKNFAASREWLELELLRKAFDNWQKRR